MPVPIIPWEPGNIPDEIQAEFERRKTNRGFNFVNASTTAGWDSDTGDWSKYKGPMTSWIRFCSNGAGRPNNEMATILQNVGGNTAPREVYDKQGFVLFGGKNFYTSYGFNSTSTSTNSSAGIIGYMPDGSPHIIENDVATSNYPVHVPPPEVERISVVIQKELYRRATVEWTCFSSKQLEYMTPYFLVPGITCILEWGWNHFDTSTLLNLNDTDALKQLKINPYPLYTNHIKKSHGNYDVLFGVITHMEWSIEGNRIKCKTEITSPDRLYAGLASDSTATSNVPETNSGKKDDGSAEINERFKTEDSLQSFVKNDLKEIRGMASFNSDKFEFKGSLIKVKSFVEHLKKVYPDRWKEIVYGIYFGRDLVNKFEDSSTTPTVTANDFSSDVGFGPEAPSPSGKINEDKKNYDELNKKFSNCDKDFDRKAHDNTWVNMELLVEVLNYYSKTFKLFKDKPIFRIDISDCVISGHKNLISINGKDVLFPNADAPKYFYGLAAEAAKAKAEGTTVSNVDMFVDAVSELTVGDIGRLWDMLFGKNKKVLKLDPKQISKKNLDKDNPDNQLADLKVHKVCFQDGYNFYRDNLDEIINRLRYKKLKEKTPKYAFPFEGGFDPNVSSRKKYPAKITGHLKDIYFSLIKFDEIVQSSKTHIEIMQKVLDTINDAGGGLWDFKIVNSTGKDGLKEGDPVTMKVIDFRFVGSVNAGKVFTFDYFDADSILQSIKFTPTLTNAQAIRTMYADTNNPQNTTTLTDSNLLLDYHFKDRLRLDESNKRDKSDIKTNQSFMDMLARVQNETPPEGAYQVSELSDDKLLVRRLAIPPEGKDLLKLMLDDDDREFNPRYTGIMPGIQAQFTMQGIGGLRTFMMFLVRNLPEPYSHKNIVFRIIDLTENLEGGKWTTTITAGIIPLRGHVRSRLGLTNSS